MKKQILTKNEFHIICDALNGSTKMESKFFPHLHWSKKDIKKEPYWQWEFANDIIDAIVIWELQEKYEIDMELFMDKLEILLKTNKFCNLLNRVDLFWRKKLPLNITKSN
jgi:hypothetical protein